MVSLRYHIVSVVAVFLALGVGIVMGSTVIDRGIVAVLNRRVDQVEASLKATNETNRRLNDQLNVWARFADQGRDQLLQGRLKDVPVLVVAVIGVDRRPLDDLRHQLGIAQARLQGTVWMTRKLRLDNDGDTRALTGVLDAVPQRPDELRRLMVERLAAVLATGSGTSLLPALRDAAFVDYEPAETPGARDLGAVAEPGTRIVLVSGAGAQVADDQMALPLAEALGGAGARVLAAESGQDTPGGRSVFVGLVRGNSDVSGRVSTVDNLESFVGQTAGILALEDLAVPKVGHFGVGPGAQRELPAAPPS